jgi:GxxExxY protein
MQENNAPHKELTARIIEAAIEVHRVLGPGFLEAIYEEALAHEFHLRGIPYERQKPIVIRYKDIVAGEQRLDLLVDGKVIVELKAIKDFEAFGDCSFLYASDEYPSSITH